jgi:carboxyl-terminal processing protease
VISPIDDTPAAKAGLQANDIIMRIDGEEVLGLTLEQAVDKMRGAVNTPITLTVVRKGRDEPFDVRLVREVIHINPLKARFEGDIIYVKIASFSEATHVILVNQVAALKTRAGKAIKGYIIDLRNDPGGAKSQSSSRPRSIS